MNKHMSAADRESILEGLNDNLSFSAIAKIINMDRTSIFKEIRNHRIKKESLDPFRKKCKNLRTCSITRFCPHVNCHDTLCRTCKNCISVCHDFVLDICDRLLKPPYVCNGCPNRTYCHRPIKYFYRPSAAQISYEQTRSSSREGINITENQLKDLDSLISPLVLNNGQHLYHIYMTHEDQIPVSLRTLYDYINKGYFQCKNIDLPKKVSYKPRKTHTRKKINQSKLRQNRTYDDYLKYMCEHSYAHVIEMDTVEGLKGGPLLLTLHAVRENFQIAHLIHNKESRNIKPVFDLYRERFDDDKLFVQFFEVILTDNGKEFSDILFLEKLGIHVFFCDPNRSDQKGSCEKNHEYIRYYIPKETSFSWISMREVWLMMSHINSIVRKSLNKKCPYEVVEYFWGKAVLEAFHIFYVKPEEVIFNNKLFDKKK